MRKSLKTTNGKTKETAKKQEEIVKKPKNIDEILQNNAKKVSNMKNLKQTNGKIEETAPNFKKNTIYQILGDTGMHTYGTMEVEVYTKQLNEMTRYDLIQHASRVCVFPYDNRERLQRELVNVFNRYVAGYRIPEKPKVAEKKPSAEILRILAEGK